MAARRGFEESDSEDDDSSVASSWTVQSEPRASYPVDHILAQKEEENGQALYLVKWTGYPESRSTWEPAANLGATTIDQWLDRIRSIRRGFDKPFDLVTWERQQEITRDADVRRWQQRVRRLTKQRRPADPPEDHPAAEKDSSSDIEQQGLFVSSPPKPINPAAGRKTSAARLRLRVVASANRNIKRMQENQIEQKQGADIMVRFAEEPQPKRKRKLADEERHYKSVSHRWNVEKAGRDGAAPKAEDIILARPGEIQQTDFTRSGVLARVSETRSSPSETRRPSVADGPLAPHAGNIPLSCFYWVHGTACPVGKEQCHFTHGEVGRAAEHLIHEQALETGVAFKPKFYNPTEVCDYWARPGGCDKGDTGCWFAHWYPTKGPWVRYHLNDRTTQPTRSESEPQPQFAAQPPYDRPVCRYWQHSNCWLSAKKCRFLHEFPPSSLDATQQRSSNSTRKVSKGSLKVQKTCSFWLRGDCNKSDESCNFVHEQLAEVASFVPPPVPGRSRYDKVCPYWADGFCTKTAENCKFLHEFVDNTPIAPYGAPSRSVLGHSDHPLLPAWTPRDTNQHELVHTSLDSYQPSSKKRKCDSYRPASIQMQFNRDEVESALTTNDSDQPQPSLESTEQAGNKVVPSDPDFAKAMTASNYFDRLASASTKPTDLKIQVTLAQTPQTSPLTSRPNDTIFDAHPPFLAEMGAESCNAMDIDSDSVGTPESLDVFFQISDASTAIPVQIMELASSATDLLIADFSSTPEIVLSKICMREFLEGFVLPLAPTVLSTGKVIEVEGQNMVQLANTLTEQRSAAIVQGPSSLLVLYPSHLKLDQNLFVERVVLMEPNCHICIEVRAAGSNFPTTTLPSSSSSLPKTLERLFLKNHGWKPEDFFSWQPNRNINKNVYIMAHPTSHKSETEMLARYFRELQAEVWIPGTKGSWTDFLRLDQGVIVFHPDFKSYEGVPSLRRLLLTKFNIFQLGVEMKDGIPSRLNCKKIMTRGTCTLLTDEMYTQLPCESLDLLNFIAKKNAGKMEKSSKTWGVYGRPLLSDFLLDLSEIRHEGDDEAKSAARTPLYDVAELLEISNPGAPLLSSEIEIDPSEALDFDEFRKNNPAQAAWKLLEAFATESLNWADDYRRVVVVYPPGGIVDPSVKEVYEEWEASPRAQHISFMVPEKFMRTFN